MSTAPQVFVSHASEDKDRFVLPFANALRKSGVDAWLDKWEILPGDSLVDKLFEEGLKNARAVIIVISENSVNKPWVKEELWLFVDFPATSWQQSPIESAKQLSTTNTPFSLHRSLRL